MPTPLMFLRESSMIARSAASGKAFDVAIEWQADIAEAVIFRKQHCAIAIDSYLFLQLAITDNAYACRTEVEWQRYEVTSSVSIQSPEGMVLLTVER